jgi:hypothetical protein
MENQSLDERKLEIQEDINDLKSKLLKLEQELKQLQDIVEVTTKDLYSNIEQYFTVEVFYKSYERILGGDGRSSPWSETVKGNVAIVKLNNKYYITEQQKEIIKEYIYNVYKPNRISFE